MVWPIGKRLKDGVSAQLVSFGGERRVSRKSAQSTIEASHLNQAPIDCASRQEKEKSGHLYGNRKDGRPPPHRRSALVPLWQWPGIHGAPRHRLLHPPQHRLLSRDAPVCGEVPHPPSSCRKNTVDTHESHEAIVSSLWHKLVSIQPILVTPLISSPASRRLPGE